MGIPVVKKKDTVLREFARSLSDEDLKWVLARLNQRLGGDLGEVLEALQLNPEMDRLFASAKDSFGLYDLTDETTEYLEREIRKRSYAGVTPEPAVV